ncbi:MAG: DUF3617 family protein [Nitrospiraceae bacterium]|nr:MAG: DUF3617 family protein [Nitrospiraceae bacterium]
MYYKVTALITTFLVLFLASSSSALELKDGLWEITSSMEMPGMKMPPFKHTQCLTSKDSVPRDKPEDTRDCKIINTSTKGNTVTWEIKCTTDGETVKSIGKITYKGDTFDGETRTRMEGMDMVQKMSGRRIGNCK